MRKLDPAFGFGFGEPEAAGTLNLTWGGDLGLAAGELAGVVSPAPPIATSPLVASRGLAVITPAPPAPTSISGLVG